jgi:hypothetical protein
MAFLFLISFSLNKLLNIKNKIIMLKPTNQLEGHIKNKHTTGHSADDWIYCVLTGIIGKLPLKVLALMNQRIL